MNDIIALETHVHFMFLLNAFDFDIFLGILYKRNPNCGLFHVQLPAFPTIICKPSVPLIMQGRHSSLLSCSC